MKRKKGAKLKKFNRTVSVLLVVSMLMSTASCSKKFDESMLSVADKACAAVASGDYSKASKFIDGKNKKLEEAMTFDSGNDITDDIAEMILSTVSYEVDEDSFESDFFGKNGTVDVLFTYVDFEKVLDDTEIFKDFDAFEEALDDCDDVVEFSVTLEFEKQDGKAVIVNSDDLIDLFAFSDVEIELAGLLADHVTSFDFMGAEYDTSVNTYTDTSVIEFNIDLDEIGTEFDWDYYYTFDAPIDLDDSDLLTKPAGESSIDIVVPYPYTDEVFDDGEYTLSVYDGEGILVCAEECLVTHTEPEPEIPANPNMPYYVTSYDSPASLYGSDIVVNVPNGWSIESTDGDYLTSPNLSGNVFIQNAVIVISSREGIASVTYLTPESYSGLLPDFQTTAEGMAAGALRDGENITYTQVEREIAGQTVTCYDSLISGNGEEYYSTIFLIDIGDGSGYLVIYGGSSQGIEQCCGSFAVQG